MTSADNAEYARTCTCAVAPARSTDSQREPLTGKRVADLIGASVLLVSLTPLILAVIVILRLTGAPVLYRHPRIGRRGRNFECLKFSTMVVAADRALQAYLETDPAQLAEWTTRQKLECDPRVTPIGRHLRRWGIDEVPQLWNVIRGEMSLVGPRPVVHAEQARYGHRLNHYRSVQPGLTGLWQVRRSRETSYRRRVALDVCYVRRRGLILDLVILLKTPWALIRGDGSY